MVLELETDAVEFIYSQARRFLFELNRMFQKGGTSSNILEIESRGKVHFIKLLETTETSFSFSVKALRNRRGECYQITEVELIEFLTNLVLHETHLNKIIGLIAKTNRFKNNDKITKKVNSDYFYLAKDMILSCLLLSAKRKKQISFCTENKFSVKKGECRIFIEQNGATEDRKNLALICYRPEENPGLITLHYPLIDLSDEINFDAIFSG